MDLDSSRILAHLGFKLDSSWIWIQAGFKLDFDSSWICCVVQSCLHKAKFMNFLLEMYVHA